MPHVAGCPCCGHCSWAGWRHGAGHRALGGSTRKFARPTDLPWGLYISPARRPAEFKSAERFHPTFLYESLWDLVVFALLVWWIRPRWHDRPGGVFFWYIGLYSVGRLFIEALRVDSFWAGSYRVAQIASFAGILFAVVGLIWISRRPQPLTTKR